MFERLAPPWLNARELQRQGTVAPGDWRVIEVAFGPVAIRWKAVHLDWEPGYAFTDQQVCGPFAIWRHEHSFEDSDESCILIDRVTYRLPGSPLSHWLGEPFARRQVWRGFAYRHLTTKIDITRHYRYRDRPRLRAVVSGSPRPAARQLAAFLSSGGHDAVLNETLSPGCPNRDNGLNRVWIDLDGDARARVSWPAHGGESGGELRADPGVVQALARLAACHHPVFGGRDAAGIWVDREALFTAVHHRLMAGGSAAWEQ